MNNQEYIEDKIGWVYGGSALIFNDIILRPAIAVCSLNLERKRSSKVQVKLFKFPQKPIQDSMFGQNQFLVRAQVDFIRDPLHNSYTWQIFSHSG